MFNKLPDDEWFAELDPVLKLWLYESWCQDLVENHEFAKNYAILSGSFANPEMARSMVDDKGKFTASDEDFERSAEMILNGTNEIPRRRRRHIVNG